MLAEDTAPSAVVSCCIFPALGVDVQGLRVALADIFEAQLVVANSSLARGQFAVEDVLGHTAIFHPAHMGKPPQPALSE